MRAQRNLKVIVDELNEKGLTKSEIAKNMGISYRTLASYYDYFAANRPNRHSRKPPEHRIKKLKELAQKKKIRVTKDIESDPIKDKILLISVNYSTKIDNEEQKRHTILRSSEGYFLNLSEKQQKEYLKSRILTIYRNNKSETEEIKILSWQSKNEDEFKQLQKI